MNRNYKLYLPTVLSAIIIIVFFNRCNNADKKNEIPKTEINTAASASTEVLSTGDFGVLKLSKAQLVTLFTASNTKKVLLQFVDDNTAGNTTPIRLIAYGATNNNVKTSGPVLIDLYAVNPININGTKYLGNLEISKGAINAILGQSGNSPINNTTAKDLYFEPTTHQLYPNYVLYNVTLAYQVMLKDSTLAPPPPPPTNPSPPADPCTTCE